MSLSGQVVIAGARVQVPIQIQSSLIAYNQTTDQLKATVTGQVQIVGTATVTGSVYATVTGTVYATVTGSVSIVGTPTVTGSVSIVGTPTVTVGNTLLNTARVVVVGTTNPYTVPVTGALNIQVVGIGTIASLSITPSGGGTTTASLNSGSVLASGAWYEFRMHVASGDVASISGATFFRYILVEGE
ncbi:MAG: hypothetical protein QXP58_06965 [Thermoprotei archaeon]